ncbi:phage tail length tape measure family protein [Antarcticirhabdus aurantiaca]|uniref:Phage tail length tape measure family protein n=1 Tax=Antarcticirhabdus aurantiaca TaxID=2606717 RepID=A0ACD4NL60_9HYPH|nr:phage tail length tape measure family protein [Jeongeuplla avenae]
MTPSGDVAREIARQHDQTAKGMANAQRLAESLQRSLDPAYRSMAKLAEVQVQLNRAVEGGAITWDRHAQLLALASDRYDDTSKSMKAANQNIKLTADQMLNLGRQAGDAATMFAMGASPLQIFSSQAAQVVDALASGPEGLTGSLRAAKDGVAGFLASLGRTNLIAAGVTTGLLAVGGAAAYFMNRGVDAAKKAEAAQQAFNRALRDTKSAYGDLAGAAERVMERESFVSPIVAQQRLAGAVKAQKDAREAAIKALRDVPGAAPDDYAQNLASELGGILSGNEFDPIRKEIEAAVDAVISAGLPLAEFEQRLSALQIDPKLEEETYNWRSALLAAVDAAVKAENAIEGLQQAVVEANFATWTKALADARGQMAGFIPEAKSAADQIEEIYQRQVAAIRNLGGDDRDIQARMRQAGEDRAKAIGELSRDAVRQAQEAQDALSNLSLSDDERTLTAIRQRYDFEIAELERLNGSEEAVAAKRREREAALAAASVEIQQRLDDEAQAYRDASQARIDGIDRMTAGLEAEIATLGMSEGAAAAYRFEMEALAAAKAAAAQAGRPVTEDELRAIQDATGDVAALTDQLIAMREAKAQADRLADFEEGLNFDISIAGLPEAEQEIRRTLNDLGVAFDSEQGQRLAGNMRFLDSLDDTKSELINVRDLVEDAAGSIIDGFGDGKSAVDGFIDALAGIGRTLASAGLNRFMDGIFGTGQGAPVGVAGAIGQAASSVAGRQVAFTGSGTYGFSMPQTYAAPVMPVQREVLPALGRMTDSLDAAAKAIRTIESGSAGGNYSAMGPITRSGDRAYGAYQVMGANIPSWSKAALGRIVSNVEFLGSREIQDAVFSHRFGGYMQKYGAEGASRAWFAGEGGMRNYRATDVVGTSVGGYGSRFGQLYAQHGAAGGYVAPERVSSTVDFARAVEVGSINATRKVASGGVPGVDPWSGMRTTTAPGLAVGSSAGAQGGGTNLLGGALGAVGIGVSAYQSGDPLGGALSGGLGGMELGSMLGIGGPAGMLLGAGIGLLGGLFGSRSKKKEEARQRKMAADQAWSDNYNSLLEYKDVVYRTPKGALSGQLTELERTLDQFSKLADATKDSGNRQHIEDIRDQLGRYSELLKSMFRDTLPTVLEDLSAGRGLDTAFTKARDSVQAEAEAYRGLIEDVKLSFQPDFSGRDAIIGDYKDQVASIEKQRRLAQNMARVGDLTVNGDGGINDPASSLPAKMKAFGENLVAAEIERDKAVAAWEAANADVQARYDEAVGKAVTAAREGLLRIVSGDVVEQSDIEAALAEARGAAAGLDVALKDLGMSAEEAATAIQGALDKRIALLAETFTRGLQDQIDELDGKGYLAGFRDLIEQRDTLLKDASLINVDTSLVSTFFQKQAQALVDGAELTGEGFADLIKLFPELSGVVKAFADDMEETLRQIAERIEGYDERRFSALEDTSTLSGAMSAFNRRAARERYAEGLAGGEGMFALDAALAAEKVATIQDLLTRARQDEVSEIEDTINRLEGLRDEWKDLRDSLKLDDTLSPLSQYDQFLEAQKQFRETVAAARGTGPEAEEAQAKLAGISQSYLEEAKAYYASSEDYYAAFREVQGVLETSETLADQQLKLQQGALDIAKKQLDAMTGVKDSIGVLQAALVAALAASKAANAAAGVVPGVGGGTGTPGTGGGTGGTGTGGSSFIPKNDLEHFLGVQYGAILGRAPDAAGVAYYQALRDQGATADQLIAMIKNSPEAQGRGYAFGGLVSGPGTGTSDSIMARLSAGEFVMPARAVTPQTLPMLEGMRSGRMAGNDNAEMIAELRGLRAEVRSLRATVAEGELANVAATRAGVAAQQAAAVEQKKAASR